jgi:two-component system, NarL family, nitrate/nitrite response regulator NarL
VHHNPSTSTVIIGQHTLLREGLAALLQHSSYKVVASAGNAAALKDIRVASDRQPLAIITIDDTVGSFGEAADNIRTLRSRFACPTIVVVAETRNPVDVQKIASLSPTAYIANLTSRELLFKVLDLLALAQPVLVLSPSDTTTSPSESLARPAPIEGPGGNGHGPDNAQGIARDGKGPPFSQRERQILCQLARGSSNKEIARLFSITESTVKVHLKALLRKIGVRNRTQAAIWAVGRDHLEHPPSAQNVGHSPRPIATSSPTPLPNKLSTTPPVPLLAMRSDRV